MIYGGLSRKRVVVPARWAT
jgi:hypothetical protein